MSHDEAMQKSEHHHAKRRRGLSYILGTCSRWQNKNELPFLQVALGVEMFPIATPVKPLGLFTALSEGHSCMQDSVTVCGHVVCHLGGPRLTSGL